MPLGKFQEKVWREGRAHNRDDLPWRFIDDPYAVLVSEVMLQQTQVKRVLSFWPAFLEAFPDLKALAAADTAEVLRAWQGLGYNRRALALQKCAQVCVADHGGELPATEEKLRALPGIGPATAAGVQAFARNIPGVYLETNVRTVFLHELFPGEVNVPDKRIAPLVAASCSHDKPREWYYALLDFGAHLKSQVANPSRRSSSYSRQSKFEGSHRQKRSFILKQVLAAPGIETAEVKAQLDNQEIQAGRARLSQEDFDALVEELTAEGFFKKEGTKLG